MAATTGSATGGKRNYYNVSYGKISTKEKEVPEGFTEIAEADLKSKTQAVEQVDLRKKYVNKGTGERPYSVFYDSLMGVIQSQEKVENDNGVSLNLSILDKDGEDSILQVKFYSKYTENLLNRLLNTNSNQEFVFFPYQIPTEAEIDGVNKKFYNQGVSLKVDGVKIESKYKADNKDLPPTEQIKVQGKPQTSRDKRLDFLYSKFCNHFSAPTQSTPKVKQTFESATNVKTEEHDDLPF